MLCALPYPHLGTHGAYGWHVCRGTRRPCVLHVPQKWAAAGRCLRCCRTRPRKHPAAAPAASPPTQSITRDASDPCTARSTKATAATAPAGTASRAGRSPSQIRPPSSHSRTRNSDLYSLKIRLSPPKKSCWYVNSYKSCWSGTPTHVMSLHFKGIYSCILVHSLDPINQMHWGCFPPHK